MYEDYLHPVRGDDPLRLGLVERLFGIIEGVPVCVGLVAGRDPPLPPVLVCLLQSVLLLLDSLVPVQVFDIEIHRGSTLEHALFVLCSDCNIHAPEHILLGVREVVFIHRIDDTLPGVLVRKLAPIRAFLGRLVPAGLQLGGQ